MYCPDETTLALAVASLRVTRTQFAVISACDAGVADTVHEILGDAQDEALIAERDAWTAWADEHCVSAAALSRALRGCMRHDGRTIPSHRLMEYSALCGVDCDAVSRWA